jgi:hypothetical protein
MKWSCGTGHNGMVTALLAQRRVLWIHALCPIQHGLSLHDFNCLAQFRRNHGTLVTLMHPCSSIQTSQTKGCHSGRKETACPAVVDCKLHNAQYSHATVWLLSQAVRKTMPVHCCKLRCKTAAQCNWHAWPSRVAVQLHWRTGCYSTKTCSTLQRQRWTSAHHPPEATLLPAVHHTQQASVSA